MNRLYHYLLGYLLLIVPAVLNAQVQLSPLFSDNMVMQQQTDAPIWGTAKPATEITITPSWSKQSYRVKADAYGHWQTKLKTPRAGGPYEIVIKAGTTLRLSNVLIGEVWFCSGQSNMEMPVNGWTQVKNFEQEVANAKYPQIRLLQVEKNTSPQPIDNCKVAGGSWQVCAPENISGFSATAYFFGRDLHQKLDVPIGLIHASWGGTCAEAWTSGKSLQTMPVFSEIMSEIGGIPLEENQRKQVYQSRKAERETLIKAKDFGFKDGTAIAAASNYDDHAWDTMNLPGFWEQSKLPGFDGYVWFRKSIDIPSAWQGKALKLSLGGIDDNEITYFNGVEIGRTDGVSIPRQYTVPAHLVKKGTNIVTVRVADTGGDGGFQGGENEMFVALTDNEKISLSGEWKFKPALSLREAPSSPRIFRDDPNNPTYLFNAMVHPFIPYAIKGAIWYRGEANEGRAYRYRELFPLMINDWRQNWGYDFPFYFVQLANFRSTEPQPTESDWAELREAQAGALHLDNTGMAVTIDIGEAGDVHPRNKQDVGGRLAIIAANKTYGGKAEYSGPMYRSHQIVGNQIRISFSHTEGGLKARDGESLKGFAVAGVDHKYHWAEAVIKGNEIWVSAPEVVFPIAVRYAWANNPVCNLYNGAGLPASPFRTDDWPGVTYGVEY